MLRTGGKQALTHQRSQVITHTVFIPDSTRKQPLHAVGSILPGVFRDLPPIFARNIAQDGLQSMCWWTSDRAKRGLRR
ncbi:hypothetical protein [Tengunoibacter tsumagoiensis]|uniref:hypothetical protein n=1 Tax=Tengunoibacter tsumagoiensis TaxID=2014871 RepID=UPI0035317AFF